MTHPDHPGSLMSCYISDRGSDMANGPCKRRLVDEQAAVYTTCGALGVKFSVTAAGRCLNSNEKSHRRRSILPQIFGLPLPQHYPKP